MIIDDEIVVDGQGGKLELDPCCFYLVTSNTVNEVSTQRIQTLACDRLVCFVYLPGDTVTVLRRGA